MLFVTLMNIKTLDDNIICTVNSEETEKPTMVTDTETMMKKMCHENGFIAALDQSGGSSE